MGYKFSGKDEALVGKKVKIVCTDGDEVVGKVIGFTTSADSDDGIASIDLVNDPSDGIVMIFENEVSTIEKLN